MPATPMKEAALRYSPEMAEAFQPTLTLRPATKKSLADFELFSDQKPMATVTMTVMALKAKIQGSTVRASMGAMPLAIVNPVSVGDRFMKARKWAGEKGLTIFFP